MPRKPVPLRIDIENCKNISLSRLLQTTLVQPKTGNQKLHVLKGGGISPQSPHSKLRANNQSDYSLSPTSPRTPHVLPYELPDAPPLNPLRGGWKRTYTATGNVESDVLPSPTNEEVWSLRHDSLLSLKEACSLCLNPSMLRLNGIDLECGHLAHLSCLREAKDSLRGSQAVCAHCGSECRAALKHHSVASSTYSFDTSDSLEQSKYRTGSDPTSPNVRTYVNASSHDTYEVVVRLSARKSLSNSPWKKFHTEAEQHELARLAKNAIAVTQVANTSVVPAEWGSLRIVSSFTFSTLPVTGYLFARHIILTTNRDDGFEDLVAMIDLEDEDTRAEYVIGQGLRLTNAEKTIKLKGSNVDCSKWSSAFDDLSLKFPIAQESSELREPIHFGQLDSCPLDCVLCTPIKHISHLLPKLLQQLGPQDRLGLVVVTEHGTCAWLAPHKPSWKYWRDMTNFDLESCNHFIPATSPILETAEQILSEENSRRQRSVIVISGCPLVSKLISSNLTVHAIGCGAQHDLDLLAELARQSTNGKFYHVESDKSLANCCAGLVAADRTVLHHDVNLRVTLENECVILDSTPAFNLAYRNRREHTTSPFSHSQTIFVGSLLAGQTRTILLEVKAPTSKVGSILAHCAVESKSSASGLPRTTSFRAIVDHRRSTVSVSRPVFFDRLALISAKIVQECIELAREEKYETMLSLLHRAAAKIESTAMTASENYDCSIKQPNIIELTEPENSHEVQISRSHLLAKGLFKLGQQIRGKINYSQLEPRALLMEAAQVLETQCAVTDKTLLEAVFFDSLDCNRI